MERIERRKKPVADRGRARSRKLLPADDGAETWKTGLPTAKAGHSGLFEHGNQTRILLDQRGHSGREIGLGVDEVRHAANMDSARLKRHAHRAESFNL